MTRISLMVTRLAACVLLATSLRASPGSEEKPEPRPNIVYIMADDLGYGELGCYGQKIIRTPVIDRLAADGLRFTQFYAGSAVCAPSRCVLMTGLHGGHAFVRNNHEVGGWSTFRGQIPLPSNSVTLAEMLKKRGYATGCFGKWGLGAVGSSGDPLEQGFDRFFGYNCQRHAHNYYPRFLISDDQEVKLEGNDRGLTGAQYAPDRINEEMLKFIRQHKDGPFFVYYPTIIPHVALQVPEDSLAEYRGKIPDAPYDGKSGYLPHPHPHAAYAAMVTRLDGYVGRVLDLLEQLGLEERTIVFFTSDNGPTYDRIGGADSKFFNSAGPLSGLKGSLREGGIRVPMIVRWPGHVPVGKVTDHAACAYDLMATLADLAGPGARPPSDGISFAPTLLGRSKGQRVHDYLFWDFAGYGGQLAVRMGRWKGLKEGLRKDPDAPLQLYDLKEDVAETKDVSGARPEVTAEIEKIMLRARTMPEVERFRFGKYQVSKVKHF